MTDQPTDKCPIADATEFLVRRQKHGEWVSFVSPEGMRYAHLRYDTYKNSTNPMQLMFKRSPEMLPFYPKIRDWFSGHGLDWKDATIDGEKYMTAQLPLSKGSLVKLITSAQDDIFRVKHTSIHTPDGLIGMKIMGARSPYLWALSVFTFLICFVALALYELFRLPGLGPPSLAAITREELFLFVLIQLSILGSRYGFINKARKRSKKRSMVKYAMRAALLALVGLAFFTY